MIRNMNIRTIMKERDMQRTILIPLILIFCIMAYLAFTPQPKNEAADDPSQNPKARAEYWRQIQGNNDDGQKIKHARIAIERQLREKDSPLYRDAGVNGWDDLGPKNIGGRIRAIAINPGDATEIFIGGAAGGIWRSTNSGGSWSVVTPAPLAYPVTSIVFDPNNNNIIYASTGEFRGGGPGYPGIGVLKSTDGGSSWQVLPLPPGASFLWLSKIVINPLNSNIIYVAGSTANSSGNNGAGVLYRSDDAGASWQLRYTEIVATTTAHIADLELNPMDTAELVIGTTRQALISNNSGISFTSFLGPAPLITNVANSFGRRCEIAYCQSDSNTIYILRYVIIDSDSDGIVDGRRSELWQTTNGGLNWTMLTSNIGTNSSTNILLSQGNYSNAIWVDPINCNRVLMGGIDLWKWSSNTLTRITNWTDDIGGNGSTGTNSSVHADYHMIVEDPSYDGVTNTRVYLGNDGGIYKSDAIWTATLNSGWASLVNNINITQLYDVDVSLTGDTLIGGSQDNSYFVDRTGNGTDISWAVFSTGDGGYSSINKSNPEIMYTSIQRGNLFKSTDGGDSFCRLMVLDSNIGGIQCVPYTVYDENPLFIAPIEMDPNNYDRIYAGAERLVTSNDAGNTWQYAKSDQSNNRAISTIEIAKGDSNTIWVGYNTGDVALTTNGGTSWTPVDANGIGLPNSFITDIAINPNNHNEVMVTVGGGYSQVSTYYTNDAGQSWSNRSLNFSMLVYSVVWHPENGNWVYIGTALGIFASEDDGQTWSVTPLFNQSEGPIYTGVMRLVWQGDGTNAHPYYLVAGTHGRGVWRTKAPVRANLYVDKNCSPCGTGSFSRPYKTFKEAVAAAGSGSNIYFLSAGDYDEVPPEILMQKRIKVRLHSSVNSSIFIK